MLGIKIINQLRGKGSASGIHASGSNPGSASSELVTSNELFHLVTVCFLTQRNRTHPPQDPCDDWIN